MRGSELKPFYSDIFSPHSLEFTISIFQWKIIISLNKEIYENSNIELLQIFLLSVLVENRSF